MAKKKSDQSSYHDLLATIDSQELKSLYVFHGEETYLLERTLDRIRAGLVTGDFAEFNYRRMDAQNFSVNALAAAVETLPVFAERTLVEIRDVDIFKLGEEARDTLRALVSDLPEYLCLIFVYTTMEFAPDKRQKLYGALKNNGGIVDFCVQDTSRLIKWIKAHFKAAGKVVDTATAEHLAFMTGGLMTTLNTEIEKLCSMSESDTITRSDIDEAVTPSPEAVSYQLADAIAARNYKRAAGILEDLLALGEPPHRLMYGISLKMRQLLTARCCLDASLGEAALTELADLRHSLAARNLMKSAAGLSVDACRAAVRLCAETAFRLNSGVNPETGMRELLLRLYAANSGGAGC